MIRKLLQTALFVSLAWSLSIAPAANAGFYNFGTLDVRPVHEPGEQNTDWFIEYLKPGEQKQQSILVSNFSGETKHLTLYTTDTSLNEGKNFYTKTVTQKSDDVADWISLPVSSLTLHSGESKLISVNFRLPQNAGVGTHTGAIIVRENGTEFAAEKGVRVYMNVIGPAITKGSITAIASTETKAGYTLQVRTRNEGTTDYSADYSFALKDLLGGLYDSGFAHSRAEPQTGSLASITISKPAFGFYNKYLSTPEGEQYIGSVLFLPFWMPLAVLVLALAALRPRMILAVLRPRVTLKKARKIWNIFQAPELKRSFAYIGLLALVATGSMVYAAAENDLAKAQIAKGQTVRELTPEGNAAESYELTVKWGQFRNVLFPGEKRKEWHGRLFFANARIKTTQLLHFERSDQAEVVGNKTALRFDAVTGPDNDGIVIYVEPTGQEVPTVRFENYETGEEFEFLITDYLNSGGVYPDRYWGTYFKTEYSEQERLRLKAIGLTTLRELDATPELEATPAPKAQIPELENLFIEELPATREALSDFILQSDYVEKIVEENSTRKVETDTILIKALEATPEVLAEVAATPDLNFLFIPTETINFPAQEFSFNEDKDSQQELGTLIFVQNKEEPWNTFIGTTDFQLLSGSAIIPASALTIIPGQPTVLKDSVNGKITAGPDTQLSGSFSRTTLVNVDATPGQNEVFVLNPKLRIRIPRGTPAGTYRGELTITSL